jgi:hypothetical protein
MNGGPAADPGDPRRWEDPQHLAKLRYLAANGLLEPWEVTQLLAGADHPNARVRAEARAVRDGLRSNQGGA